MRKKLILLSLTVLMLIGAFAALYRSFGSETIAMQRDVNADGTVITQSIKLSEIAEFSKEKPGKHVFLIRDNKEDSDYVINNVLTPLAMESTDRPTPDIISVDLSDTTNTTVTRLKNMFNVDSYPSFILAEFDMKTNTLKVESSITSKTEKPMTGPELKQWFFDNGQWSGFYKE